MGTVFEKRWFMLDFARLRSLERGEMLRLLDILKRSGYNGLGLYVEGAFVPARGRGVPRKGSLTREDADFLKAACGERGLFLFPLTNTVYHMEHFLTQERYADLRDTGGHERYQLKYELPEAKAFVMEKLHEVQSLFGAPLLHVGGDEAILPPERLPDYARFVGDLCRALLNEGITPAVWGDMFWGKPELAPFLPRETVIFDWYYGGHRPESLRFFREQGFADVLPCPCDDGWCHFINRQEPYPEHPQTLDPGEIEAFLEDGAEAGCTGALVTHWEDINGHNLWANLVPIVRAGLYLSGRWDPARSEAEQVEQVLFGRVTPYTEITHILRETATSQASKLPVALWHMPSHALIHEGLAFFVLTRAPGFWAMHLADYPQAEAAARPLLDAWTPAGEIEDACKRALLAVLAAVNASLAMMRLSEGRRVWHEAALAQFEDTARFVSKLDEVTALITQAEQALDDFRAAFLEGIRGTGISDLPMRLQEDIFAEYAGLKAAVASFREPGNEDVAIPAWHELVQDWKPTQGGLVG